MSSFSHLHQEFFAQGFVILEHFFTEEDLRAVNRAMDTFLSHSPQQPAVQANFTRYSANTVQIGQEAAQDPAFQHLHAHPGLQEVTRTTLGTAFHDEGLLVQVSFQGLGQAWHRDCHYPDPQHFLVNRLIYARDFPEASGTLIVVPGSHKLAELPPGGAHDPIAGEIAIKLTRGTLALVHSSTFHRVNPNQTTQPRFSINYRVRPEGAPANLGRFGVYRNGTYDFKTGMPVE